MVDYIAGMGRCILLLFLLFFGCDAQTYDIYGDSYAPGWSAAPMPVLCNTDANSPNQPFNNTGSCIRASCSSTFFANSFTIQNGQGVNTTNFTFLEFYIRTENLISYNLTTTFGNTSTTSLSQPAYLTNNGTFLSNAWQLVRISMFDLGAENARITSIQIVPFVARTAFTIYVDLVRLVAVRSTSTPIGYLVPPTLPPAPTNPPTNNSITAGSIQTTTSTGGGGGGGGSSSNAGGIAAGVIIAVLVVAGAVGGFVVYRRRKHTIPPSPSTRSLKESTTSHPDSPTLVPAPSSPSPVFSAIVAPTPDPPKPATPPTVRATPTPPPGRPPTRSTPPTVRATPTPQAEPAALPSESEKSDKTDKMGTVGTIGSNSEFGDTDSDYETMRRVGTTKEEKDSRMKGLVLSSLFTAPSTLSLTSTMDGSPFGSNNPSPSISRGTSLLGFEEVSPIVTDSIHYLLEKGLKEEGILRLAGSSSEVSRIKGAYAKGEPVNFNSCSDINSVADLLKRHLRELPEPLIANVGAFQEAMGLEDYERVRTLRELLQSPTISNAKRQTMKILFLFLFQVVQYSSFNKMSSSNLALVFAPTLRMPPDLLDTFIKNANVIFSDL